MREGHGQIAVGAADVHIACLDVVENLVRSQLPARRAGAAARTTSTLTRATFCGRTTVQFDHADEYWTRSTTRLPRSLQRQGLYAHGRAVDRARRRRERGCFF